MPVWGSLRLALVKSGMRHIWARFFIVIAIAVICLAIVFGTMARKRTFSMVATTLGGEIMFNGQQNDWHFSEVIQCSLRANPDFRATDKPQASPCDGAMFNVQYLSDKVVPWKNSDQIEFSSNSSNGLQIRVKSDTVPGMPPGSLFIIPQTAWADHGAFAFQGTVQLGGKMATGSRGYLLSGHWEALQTGMATSLVRDITDVVKSGTLVRGSTVDFIKPGGDVITYGHLTPPDASTAGIEVAVLTEKAPIALRVSYYGLHEPAIFKPDWIDTISSSTMLVALVVLLSLIAGIVELSLAISDRRKRTTTEP